ncbi:protein FAR1-RELATED SEQUENCE 5-like [Silene latifolia]|uniref:protein FAR1-RELATED SEQUENCE 5-like n=1 Tax=Silene latifolia TaxID=37657 RepID=UPI003D77156F
MVQIQRDSIPATNVHASDILVVLPLTDAPDSISAANVDALINNDIPPVLPLTNAPGYKNVGASLEDFKKISRDVRKYIKEYDAEMLLETFMQKKDMSPSFYFDFEVDDEKRLTISFDATYNFNEYKLVFCPFTGVDNHKRCVTFAGGLLRKEDGESFTWLFENFVKAMGDYYPTTIITDQCRGINQAVKDVFGDKTQHRLCMWHIMKKLSDKVGPTICQNTKFLKEINSIVWDGEIDTQEFELRWKSILSLYELSDHEWLKSMFDIRSSWIPAYFRDIYLGGIMRTTSRSESENSFFGNFTNPHLTLVEFWMRFQSAMDAQHWKYSKVTADDKNISPKLSTPLLLEKNIAEFYTTAVFYEFQEELQAACFTCGLSPRTTEDNNEHISIMDREKDKVYKVDLSGNKFSCSCKMFERIELLCKHVLWVLKDRGFDDIPREYLLDRWSKYATCRPIFNVVGTTLLAVCLSIENHQSKISELWSEVFTTVSLVEDNEELGDELLELFRSFNEKLMI